MSKKFDASLESLHPAIAEATRQARKRLVEKQGKEVMASAATKHAEDALAPVVGRTDPNNPGRPSRIAAQAARALMPRLRGKLQPVAQAALDAAEAYEADPNDDDAIVAHAFASAAALAANSAHEAPINTAGMTPEQAAEADAIDRGKAAEAAALNAASAAAHAAVAGHDAHAVNAAVAAVAHTPDDDLAALLIDLLK